MILNKETLKGVSGILGIYKITINDKEYIGSSCNIGNRLKHHLWSLENKTHHNRTMQNLYDKYGKDKVHYELVEQCSEDILIEREKHYIDLLKPYINHILDPQKIIRDKTYKKRLSEGVRKSFENGRKVVNKRPVHKYSLEGKYIESFEDMTSAGNPTSICAACKGKVHTAEGFRWSYKKQDLLPTLKKNYTTKPILQLSKDGKQLKEWESTIVAEQTLGITNISRAIKKGTLAGGYKWQHKV